MLHKIQLFIAGHGPEIIPIDVCGFALVRAIAVTAILFAVAGTQAETALAPKWRIS